MDISRILKRAGLSAFSDTVSIISEKLGSPAKTHDRGNP